MADIVHDAPETSGEPLLPESSSSVKRGVVRFCCLQTVLKPLGKWPALLKCLLSVSQHQTASLDVLFVFFIAFFCVFVRHFCDCGDGRGASRRRSANQEGIPKACMHSTFSRHVVGLTLLDVTEGTWLKIPPACHFNTRSATSGTFAPRLPGRKRRMGRKVMRPVLGRKASRRARGPGA
jgi:hypothetical protein